MKIKTVLVLAVPAALAAVAVLVFALTASPVSRGRPLFNKGEGLSSGETIAIQTWAGELGVHKGDAFPYYVEVWYDPALVTEIDKASLDSGVDLKPFEIRGVKENEFTLAPGTRVYQRAYELQLISGQAGQLYEFPAVIVRYQPKDAGGLTNVSASPEPIFVAARVPPDVPDLQFGYGPLRPIAGKIEGVSARLPWIFWTVGGLLGVLGVAVLVRRAVPRWTNTTRQRNVPAGSEAVYEAYRTLSRNGALAAEPKVLLHQMDHLLRIVLAQKEKAGWLEELDPDTISSEIREPVVALLDRCQKAYRPDVAQRADVEEAMHQIDDVLGFYFGQAEVEAWRN